MHKRTVYLYMAISFMVMTGMSHLNAYYVIFLYEGKMTPEQANLVNTIFWFTPVIMEVPTGLIADRWTGRKGAVICGLFGEVIALLTYANATSFSGYALAEFLSATSSAFISGSFIAWLKDSLRHNGGTDQDVGRVTSREHTFSRGGSAVGTLIGAWMADVHRSFPWYAATGWLAAAAVLACVMMKEPPHYGIEEKTTPTTTPCKKTQKWLLGFLIVVWCTNTIAVQVPNMMWQPLYRDKVPGVIWLGVIMAGANAMLALGAHIANKREDHKKYCFLGLIVSLAVTGVGVVGAGANPGLAGSLTWYMVHEIGRGYFGPVRESMLSALLPGKNQATRISIWSMPFRLAGVAGLLISGVMTRTIAIPQIWVIFGSGLIVSSGVLAVAYLWLRRQFSR